MESDAIAVLALLQNLFAASTPLPMSPVPLKVPKSIVLRNTKNPKERTIRSVVFDGMVKM